MSTMVRIFSPFKPHLLVAALAVAPVAQATPLLVVNHSFEDVSAPMTANGEFHFGVNNGWIIYNNAVAQGGDIGANDIFLGTLQPGINDPAYFLDPTPDGDQIAIMFGFGQGRAFQGWTRRATVSTELSRF